MISKKGSRARSFKPKLLCHMEPIKSCNQQNLNTPGPHAGDKKVCGVVRLAWTQKLDSSDSCPIRKFDVEERSRETHAGGCHKITYVMPIT